jgi:hypothetical protein
MALLLSMMKHRQTRWAWNAGAGRCLHSIASAACASRQRDFAHWRCRPGTALQRQGSSFRASCEMRDHCPATRLRLFPRLRRVAACLLPPKKNRAMPGFFLLAGNAQLRSAFALRVCDFFDLVLVVFVVVVEASDPADDVVLFALVLVSVLVPVPLAPMVALEPVDELG